MKFIPKKVDADVNLPDSHPLHDMAWMTAGLAILLVVFYLLSGVIVDQLAKFIPPEFDNSVDINLDQELTELFGPAISNDPFVEDTRRIFQKLRERLPEDDTRSYTLTILDSDEVNAMALPGGRIVVLRGLLEQAESENEVAMVLAHEFGHTYNRHHWRKLGRTILFGVMAGILGNSQSTLNNQLANLSLATMTQTNSRSHEKESDRFALELLCRTYGHSGGATDFFERNMSKQGLGAKSIAFLLTHPLSQKRVDAIQAQAADSGCLVDETKPWPHTAGSTT
ncbi:MAG: M48 family metallopeptidase [Gammaproteobacteria bacterium]